MTESVWYNLQQKKLYGTYEDKKTCRDASSFAKATEDKEVAAGYPPSPRLRRIKGRDEAADEGQWPERAMACRSNGGLPSREVRITLTEGLSCPHGRFELPSR